MRPDERLPTFEGDVRADEGSRMTANLDDLRLLRQIFEQGGSKYTAGNIDRRISAPRGIGLADGNFRQHQ